MYQANIYFGLSLHPRSTQLPALRVCPLHQSDLPPGTPIHISVPIVISLEIVAQAFSSGRLHDTHPS